MRLFMTLLVLILSSMSFSQGSRRKAWKEKQSEYRVKRGMKNRVARHGGRLRHPVPVYTRHGRRHQRRIRRGHRYRHGHRLHRCGYWCQRERLQRRHRRYHNYWYPGLVLRVPLG